MSKKSTETGESQHLYDEYCRVLASKRTGCLNGKSFWPIYNHKTNSVNVVLFLVLWPKFKSKTETASKIK